MAAFADTAAVRTFAIAFTGFAKALFTNQIPAVGKVASDPTHLVEFNDFAANARCWTLHHQPFVQMSEKSSNATSSTSPRSPSIDSLSSD